MSAAVPLDRQIACVRREVSMRKRVYPRWVATSKMTQEEADRQIEAMEAAQLTLERYRHLHTRPLDTVHRGGVFAGQTPANLVLNGDDLDQAIDADRALAAAPPPELF